ncbi:hypothetical protein PA25_34770 [Pseudoalteromonas sp. A25]|nr:hypothetical protein PA25_34770 [Pseudoalteromonas sp. A25]
MRLKEALSVLSNPSSDMNKFILLPCVNEQDVFRVVKRSRPFTNRTIRLNIQRIFKYLMPNITLKKKKNLQVR